MTITIWILCATITFAFCVLNKKAWEYWYGIVKKTTEKVAQESTEEITDYLDIDYTARLFTIGMTSLFCIIGWPLIGLFLWAILSKK